MWGYVLCVNIHFFPPHSVITHGNMSSIWQILTGKSQFKVLNMTGLEHQGRFFFLRLENRNVKINYSPSLPPASPIQVCCYKLTMLFSVCVFYLFIFFPVFIFVFVSFRVKTQNVYLIFIMNDWGKSDAGGFWQQGHRQPLSWDDTCCYLPRYARLLLGLMSIFKHFNLHPHHIIYHTLIPCAQQGIFQC